MQPQSEIQWQDLTKYFGVVSLKDRRSHAGPGRKSSVHVKSSKRPWPLKNLLIPAETSFVDFLNDEFLGSINEKIDAVRDIRAPFSNSQSFPLISVPASRGIPREYPTLQVH